MNLSSQCFCFRRFWRFRLSTTVDSSTPTLLSLSSLCRHRNRESIEQTAKTWRHEDKDWPATKTRVIKTLLINEIIRTRLGGLDRKIFGIDQDRGWFSAKDMTFWKRQSLSQLSMSTPNFNLLRHFFKYRRYRHASGEFQLDNYWSWSQFVLTVDTSIPNETPKAYLLCNWAN